MFEIGDFAVYPGHGVGAIEGIQSLDMGGQVQDFYVISILDTKMTIMVPKENAGGTGMREVIGRDKVPEVYAILKSKEVSNNNHQPWNQRYRGYMERIQSGSIFEVAKVYRELYSLKGEKELSFGERKLMDTAKRLLIKELAISKDAEEADVGKEIQGILL
ncbi:MAG: CarD family transcriptional regulator [Deltaproteobacteria bacterium RBG_16_54_18]|jgi:CarD family transcriptional regulator|nr:MAG: CarD family transcriptional regulator [Deltaproteobacteria bacterium RBG_16_54_18]